MRHIILHGHIFKNAGTTLDWALQRNFGDGFLDHRDDNAMLSDGRSHLQQLVQGNPRLCAISSHHMTRDLPPLPGVTFLPVSLLRHPIARMRSVYDFERQQQASTPGAVAAKSNDFKAYVAWRMQPEVRRTLRNYQTLHLAGQHELASDEAISLQHFADALGNVSAVSLIGVVERYDESMVVFEELLGRHFPHVDLSYIPQNVGVAGGKTGREYSATLVAGILDELGDLQKKVIDENSFDLALYQAALQRLQSMIAAIDAFPEKLQDFRQRCLLQQAG